MKFDTTNNRVSNSESNTLEEKHPIEKDKVIDSFIEKLQKYIETLSINY